MIFSKNLKIIIHIILHLFIGFILAQCTNEKIEVKQWDPHEFMFETSSKYNYFDFPIQMIFTHEGRTEQLILDAYWIGDNKWQVRFAATHPGKWNWHLESVDDVLDGKSGEIHCISPTEEEIRINPNFRGKLQVNTGDRFFSYADGSAVLLLAEQFWDFNISSWITVDENNAYNIHTYLKDRKSKGFNVVQMRFMRTSRENEGGLPFPLYNEEDPESILDSMNVGYFDFLDQRFEHCFKNGFIVAGHPEWIGSALKINLEEAKKLERFFLSRYGAYNLIYSLSGEFNKNFHNQHRNEPGIRGIWNDAKSDTMNIKRDRKPWSELGEYTSSFNAYNTPLSLHPGWHNPVLSSSGDFLHDQTWLDHNWIQTYKDVYAVPGEVLQDYMRVPPKPVFFSEGIREGDQTEAAGLGSYGNRWEAWQVFLNGAAVHTYRHFGIYMDKWFMDGLTESWPINLDAPGSAEAGIAKDFLGSLGWWKLKPSSELVRINGEIQKFPDSSSVTGLSKTVALASITGELYIIYIPRENLNNEIKIIGVADGNYEVTRFNPRTGTSESDQSILIKNRELTVPARPDNNDWVYLISNR